jgi:hypothetical protein
MAKKKDQAAPAGQILDIEVASPGSGAGQLARFSEPTRELSLTPVFNLEMAKRRMAEFQEYVQAYLKDGEDYGTIPGTPKPTLYKSGADKLCDLYGLADSYKVTNRVENWAELLFDYEVECTITSKRDQSLVSSGLGSCNSYEEKYHWRDQKRVCPKCNKATIIKGREEYGGGWICWKKEGRSDGCGAQFAESDSQITGQTIGRVANDKIPDLKNTILKMAKKRAKVDAVLAATRSSGLFTQDIEDWKAVEEQEDRDKAKRATPTPAQQARPGATPQTAKPAAATPASKPAATPAAQRTSAPPTQAAQKAAAAPPPPATQQAAAVPSGTAEPAKAPEPPKQDQKAPAKPSRSERVKKIAGTSGTSSTVIMGFMGKTFGVDMNNLGTISAKMMEACIFSIEVCLDKFPAKQVGAFLSDDANANPAIMAQFNEAYVEACK